MVDVREIGLAGELQENHRERERNKHLIMFITLLKSHIEHKSFTQSLVRS